MTLYGIGVLPLALQLKAAVPTSLQPWYADDATTGGEFDEINKVFSLLQTMGPVRRYFPKPTKSVLVAKPMMVERTKARFDNLGF